MASRSRTALLAGVVLLPLLGCSTPHSWPFDADPSASDPVNFNIAVDAQGRGNDAAAVRSYERVYRNTGHPLAEARLGHYYAEGRGAPKDPDKAAQYLLDAYSKDWPGKGEAAFYLGRLYDAGEGVPQDEKRAFELYSEAWRGGVKQAAYVLAKAYDEGTLVKPDRARAIELYKVARSNGDPRADLRLAEYAQADGAPVDQVYQEAKPGVAWLRDLAKEDNDWAEMRLATIFQEGKLVPASTELADRYLRDAAKHGNASANARLAEREEQQGDPKKALTYWRRAADGGHPSGMVRVGFAALDAGRTKEGLAWLEKAAALGHPSAMAEIGRRELTGEGEPKDPVAGLAMLEKAAATGHPSAMYALGEAYADGNGVPQDKAKAADWFQKAEAAGHPNAAKALAQLNAPPEPPQVPARR